MGDGRAAGKAIRHARPATRRLPSRHQERSAGALALENQRLRAELQARLHEVEASRLRIVAAADRERLRLERNLHDGAQQRLVALALTLRIAAGTAGDDDLGALLAGAAAELDGALDELRRLARGLHPAIVADAGLAAALETLAERPGIPVELMVELPAAVPEAVAVGAYYVVSEALANANKHSGAERVEVRAHVLGDSLEVSVCDDGQGGARVAPGSGLEGLGDRVGALGGGLRLVSEPGCGTTLSATLPLS